VKADDLRQMFLAMTEEVRVIICEAGGPAPQHADAGPHAPAQAGAHRARDPARVCALARLLGMYRVKSELEDLSFATRTPRLRARAAPPGAPAGRASGGMGEAQEKLEAALQQDQFLGS